jgi:hypothetical protein
MSVLDELTRRPSFLEDTSSNESDSEDDETDEELEKDTHGTHEDASIHSADNMSFKTGSDDSSEDESCLEMPEFFMDIQHFPVILMYLEKNEGVLDDLLINRDTLEHRPGTPQWETMWSAWIFQIMAALSVGQTLFGFTHNDLHSNNVVWSKTDKKFLHYKMNSGIYFKVPTYGKIFRIIDFGRAIFKINDHLFFSDDFKKGNDAAEQFNFGELYDSSEPEVYPNPSFDLCRFTVGIFESLFPESPPVKKGGKILSDEPDLQIHETESPLYNLLWTWLLCDDGHNVLMDPDGSERYPDFDLYKVITSQVHNAVPADQFEKDIFKSFRIKTAGNQKVYSLYC